MIRIKAALLLAVVLTAAGCSRTPAFRGTALDPPREALPFDLEDQFGRHVRMTDLQGHIVILTFLYTSCPDVCPLVTGKIEAVADTLAAPQRDVVFLAVTVDPVGDTKPTVIEYSRSWRMLDRWHFLLGSEAELVPLWAFYGAGVGRLPAAVDRAVVRFVVPHASPVHLIDRRGRVRVVYGATFSADDLAHDVTQLRGAS